MTGLSREQAAKNPQDKILEKLSKCFSRLEVPPAIKSRWESPNFLSDPCDWTFHSWTSCQHELRNFQKPRFLKIF